MSSLARQLASIASLDASRLASSAKQSSTQPSYIFSPKEAAQHDLQTIHSLGQNGFEQLLQLDSSLGPYEDELFGEAARGLDRMVLPRDENERLGGLLDKLLMRLGKHVPTRAFAKVIEWLVRRFR
jgi:U3 small nucleolar RNA-associated protein 10